MTKPNKVGDGMRQVQPKIINYMDNKEWDCLHSDAKLLFNLIDQKKRGYLLKTDYIQPGLLSGQSLGNVLREIVKSITNHLDNFDKDDVIIL